MMRTSLQDRMFWLAVGCLIGFVLGYIVRSLREIKEQVEHVADEIHHDKGAHDPEPEQSKWDQKEGPPKPKKGERGKVTFNNVALLLVILMVTWSTFQTAAVNHKLLQFLDCTTKYNLAQSQALHARDRANSKNTASEIKLWTQYAALYRSAKKNPKNIPKAQTAINRDIAQHRRALIVIQHKRNTLPYPNSDVLKACKEQQN